MARKNGFTAKQFIDAIPGTGGVVSAIADKVGCARQTAKRYIDDYPTIKAVYDEECNRITDTARSNVHRAITRGDLQTSKWWLQVKDDEFVPKQKTEYSGNIVVNWDDDNDTD
jgi:hypothetical protein